MSCLCCFPLPVKTLAAILIAPAARTWLAATPSARVLHVFERAANLVNPAGDVLSLVTPAIGPGPFAVVVEAAHGNVNFARLFDAGDEGTVRGHVLEVGQLALDTAQAVEWQPRPRWESLAGQAAALKAQHPLLKGLLARHAPPGSFAPLLDAAPGDGASPPTFETRFLEAARQPARKLRDGILSGDGGTCREAAHALAGLGGGLTPSGDDFMMGALYALWATRSPAQVAPLADAIVGAALPHTVPLSAAWLRAASRGEAGQLWHALVDALAAPAQDELSVIVPAITAVGHTSGADALAGFAYLLTPP